VGLVTAGHVHLTKVARAFGSGVTNVHAVEKGLSRHLDSPHWSIRRPICLVALAFFWLNLWLLAESLGRRPLSNPPARLPPPPWALAQGGNLSVRLAGHANQPLSPPKTPNRPPRLLRHGVNSRQPCVGFLLVLGMIAADPFTAHTRRVAGIPNGFKAVYRLD
jgi:hypothetical protein